MTLRLIEGFDHVSTPTLLAAKGWTYSGAVNAFPAGRINGRAFDMSAASVLATLTKSVPATSTFVLGVAFNLPTQAGATACEIINVRAGATATFRISKTAADKLQITNSAGTVIATGTTTINVSTWYYVELKGFVNGASGTCELQLNGVSEIASTVGNFGSTNVDNILLNKPAAFSSAAHFLFDDIYVSDATTFLGDRHVETIFPTADGNYTQWTPDTGTAHFSRVNENSGTYPDGDTSYVSDATVGHRDSYTMGDLSVLSGSIAAVQSVMYARKDDAATRQIAAFIRRSSADYDGATATLATTYAFYTEIRETDPSTSAAWDISGVNAAELGVKTVA